MKNNVTEIATRDLYRCSPK